MRRARPPDARGEVGAPDRPRRADQHLARGLASARPAGTREAPLSPRSRVSGSPREPIPLALWAPGDVAAGGRRVRRRSAGAAAPAALRQFPRARPPPPGTRSPPRAGALVRVHRRCRASRRAAGASGVAAEAVLSGAGSLGRRAHQPSAAGPPKSGRSGTPLSVPVRPPSRPALCSSCSPTTSGRSEDVHARDRPGVQGAEPLGRTALEQGRLTSSPRRSPTAPRPPLGAVARGAAGPEAAATALARGSRVARTSALRGGPPARLDAELIAT